jgi:hypothetical protein
MFGTASRKARTPCPCANAAIIQTLERRAKPQGWLLKDAATIHAEAANTIVVTNSVH